MTSAPRDACADINWDGDGTQGNFSWSENWYGNVQPTWAFSSGNLVFNFRNNSSQGSLYYDYGDWRNINDIIWETTFGAGLTLSSSGGGINFNQRIENRSSSTQTINMNFSAAKNGATQIELNPVNGDLVISGGNIYNDNNRNFFTYGNNSKMLTVGIALTGNSGVSYTIAQYSKVKFTAAQTFGSSSSFNIQQGELWIENSGSLASGMVINLGQSDANTAKFYLSGTANDSHNVNVQNSGGSKVMGGLATSGTNTFSGAVTNNGGLILENTGSGGTVAFSGVISGAAGAVTVSSTNAGTVQLINANTFGGGLTVNGGTLQISNNAAVGTGAVTLNSGTFASASSTAYTVTNTLNIGGSVTFGQSSIGTGSLTFSNVNLQQATRSLTVNNTNLNIVGVISNGGGTAAGITKAGSGTLTLSGASANTFSGASTVSAGTLILNKSANTAAIAGALTINSGASLRTDAAGQLNNQLVTVNGAFDMNSQGQSFALAGAGTVTMSATLTNNNTGSDTFSGQITGAGALIKTNSGTLILSGSANNYSGATTVGQGTLAVSGNSALGTTAAGTTVVTNATLDFQNVNYSTTEGITLNGGTIAASTGTSAFAGAITLGGGSTFNVGGTQLGLSGAITDGASTFGITKSGTGILILSNNNTYSGDTAISAGTVLAANSGALGDTGNVSVSSGAALQLSNSITVARALTLSGDGTTAGTGSLRNISGDNVWSGGISNSSGARINVDSGTLTIAGNITNADTTLYVGGVSNSTFSGTLSGSRTLGDGALFKDGVSTLTLGGNNSALSGNINLRAGTLRATNAGALGAGTIVLGNESTTTTLLVETNISRSGGIAISNSSSAGVINVASGLAFTNTGGITQSGGVVNTTKFGKDGAGTLVLGGTSTYAGQMQIGQGTVILGTSAALGVNTDAANARGIDLGLNIGDISQGNAVALLISNGQTLSNSIYVAANTSGASRTVGLAGTGSMTISNQIYMDGTLTVDAGSAASDTVSIVSNITNTGGITKTNAGILVLSASNSYTGGTTLGSGTLRAGSDFALGTGGFTINGGTFASSSSAARIATNNITMGGNVTFGDATGTGALTLSNINLAQVTRTFTVDNNTTVAGVISNGGVTAAGLTKAGAGTLVLTNANTYTGATTINNGTLLLAVNDALSDSSAVSLSAGTLNLSNRSDTIHSITMSGGTLLRGNSTITLTNASSFTGGTVTLSASGSRFNIGALLTLGAATFDYTAAGANNTALVLSNNLTTTGSGTTLLSNSGGGTPYINLASATRTFTVASGTVLDIGWGLRTGGLLKDGAGTLILRSSTSATTLSSGVTLSNGVLLVGADQALGDGFIVLNGGTIASVDSSARSFANILTNTGDVTFGQASGGTGTLAFTNTSTNNLGGATRTFTTVVDTTIAGALGNGGITKAGSGTLYLTNTSSSFGTLTINSGRVTFQTNAIITGLAGSGTSSELNLAGGNLTANLSADSSFTNTISGGGTLTKTGAATLTLGGTNTYSGGTVVTTGRLVGSTTSLQGAITNNAAVTFDQSTNGTYAGALSGLGTLVKTNTGVVTLTGANSQTGGTLIAGGALSIGSGGGTGSLEGAITNNAALVVNRTGSLSLTGNISGTGVLTNLGSGTVTLSGTNTYSGGTLISAGAVQGSTTSLQGLITNNSALIFDQSTNGTYGSVISGTGSLVKTNTGVLTLTNDNSYSGGTLIAGGALSVGNGGATGSLLGVITNNAGLVVNRTGALSLTGAITGTGALTNSGSGTLTLGGANTYSGGTVVSSGAIQGNTSALQGTITNNSLVIFTNATAGTYAGVMSGTGALTLNGTGTLTLTNANTFAGTTTITAGTLALSNGAALVDTAVITNTAGTLRVNSSETIGSLRGGGNVDLNGSGVTLTIGETGANTYAGSISNSGALTKTGAGTLTLSGSNTFTGTTTVSAGVLSLDAAGAYTTIAGNVLVNGGTLQYASGSQNNQIASTANLTISSGQFALGARTNTFASVTMSNGVLSVGSGNLVVSGASSITGGVFSNTGVNGAVNFGGALTLGPALINYTGGSTGNQSIWTISNNVTTAGAGTTIFSNNTTGTSVPFINLGAGTRTFDVIDGTVLDSAWGLRSGNMIKVGAGTLILRAAAATYTNTTLSNGVMLLGSDTALGTGGITLAGGTIASVDSSARTFANALTNAGDVTFGQATNRTASLTFSSVATNNLGGSNRTFTTYVDTTIAGALGNGSITKAETNTLYLSNASNSFGGLTINAGSVTFQTNAIITGLGEAGGTLALAGGTLTLNSTTNNSFSTVISGSGGLTKSGSGGTLTLSGANTYGGVTTINGGAISVAAANGLGANPGSATTNQLTLNGGRLNVTTGFTANANAGITIGASGGTIDVASGQTLVQVAGLNGSGNFTKTGAGVLHLTNASGGYAGAITVTNGTLQVNTTNRGANITLGNSTTRSSILKGSGVVGSVTVGDGGEIAPGNSPGTLSVSNSLTFNNGGSYAWEINSINGPAGTTWDLITVDTDVVGNGAGTLSIGTGQFTIYGSAIDGFTFDGSQNYTGDYFRIVAASSFSGAGSLANLSFSGSGLGTGSWTFSTNASGLYLNYTAAGASLVFTNIVAADQGAANLVTNNSVGAFATITNMGGPTVVTISNSAPLTFTNASNSYTGATVIEQGTLATTVDSANAANGAFGNASTDVQVGSLSGGNTNSATLLIGAGGVTVGRGITVNGGGTGVRTIGATNSSGVATYSGNIALNNPVTLSASNSGGTTLFSGIISGVSSSDTLTVAGNGIVVLSNANTYSNSTLISSGATLRLGNATALGVTNIGTTNVSGATLDLNGQTVGSEALSIAGTGVEGNGALINSASTAASWAGAVTLTNATTINTTNAGGTITIGGAVGGTGSLTKVGAGTLILTAANSYSGGTTLNAGALAFSNSSSLGTGTLTIGDGTRLGVSASGSRTIANAVVANGNFSLGGFGQSMTVSGGLNLGGATRTITFDNSATFSGVISNGGLTIGSDSASRNFTMSASNTFTGGLTINGGTAVFTGSGALVSTSTVVMNGSVSSATLDITNITGSSFTIGSLASTNSTSTVNLGAKNLIVGGNNTTTSYAGDMNGTGGSLTKNGTGTLTLSKSSTYTGGTVLNAGGLALGSSSALGTGTITLNGGAIGSVTSQRTLANNLVAGGDFTFGVGDQSTIFNGTFDLGGSTRTITLENSATLNGIVSNGGITVNNGPVGAVRNLTFGTNNTFAGPLTVNGGTVKLGANGALSSTTAVNLAGTQTNATFDLTNNTSGAVTIASLAGGTNSAVVLGTNNLTAGGDNSSTTFAGVMSGAGGFTKTGSGAMTLSGANTFSGGLTLSAGTLNLDNASTLGSGTFTIGGGTINNTSGGAITLSGNNAQAWNGDFTFTGSNDLNLGAGAVTLGASRQVTVSAGTLTVGGAISGTGFGITKLGSGSLALNGANTFTGTLNANAGTVALGSAGRLAAGSSVGIGGGALNLGGNESVSAFTITSGTLGGSGTLTAPTYTLSGGTLNANLGAGTATAATGTTDLNGTLDADLTVSGGTVNLGSSDRIAATSAVTLSSGTLGLGTSSDTVGSFTMSGGTLGGTTGVLTASTYALQGGTINAGLGAGAITVSTGTTTLGSAGRLNSGSSLTINSGQLTLAGAESVGAVTLTGGTLGGTGNTLTGTSYALQGGTIDANLGGTATATVTTGTTSLNGTLGSTTLNVNSGTLSLGAANRLADTAAVTIAGGTLGLGTLSDTVGSFTISSGTLGGTTGVLTASTYALQGGTIDAVLGAGAVTVTTGTTTLGSANRLNSGSTLAINSGQLTPGGAESVAALSGSGGTLALGANTLTTTSNSDTSFAGTITGTGGGLTKAGTGNLVLSGNNSYTGTTTISAGTVTAANNNALGTTAGSTTVSNNAALALSNNISIAEAISLNGTGVSSGGALRNVSGNNTNSGAITLGSASRINSDADSLTLNGGITGTGLALTIGGAGNTTIGTTGINTGAAGTLTKDGLGTLTITAAGDYTGATTVSAGALNIQNATATGTTAGGISVTSGAALELQGGISVGAEALTLNGTGLSSGGALRNISGNNTYGGAITLGSASRINSDANTLTLTNTISGTQNLTVGGAGNTTISGAITTSTGTLTKDGLGTLLLSSGANTFTGNVTVNAGTLAVTNGGAIANTALVTVDSASTFSVLGSETVGRFTGAGTVSIASGQTLTTSFDSASNNFSGFLTGAGGLTKTGSGTFTLSGDNSGFLGNTTLNDGTFLVGASGAFGSGGTMTINFDTGTGTRALASADASSYTLNNNFNLFFNSFSLGSANTGSLTLGASTNTFSLGSDGVSTTRTITVTGNQIIGAAITGGANNNLNKAGSGTLILAGDVSGMGGAITNAAGRLQIGNGSTTGTLGNKNVTVASSAELAFNRSDNLTYGGVASGAGALLKLGAGTVTFTGANTYTGATTISNGSLALSGSGALSSSTALNVATSGANFSISGISGTGTEVASLTGVSGSTVSLGGKALTFGANNANSTFAGEMSGTGGSFIKTGTGTVTLSGSNSMTGTAQLNDGTLLIGNNFALGTNSFQIQFDVGGTKTLASDGSTARTLQITNLNVFNNLTLGVASTGTGALTVTGRVYLGDEVGQTRTITTATGTGHTFSGAVTGNRGMIKDGSGTLTLSGANTFGGGLQLNDGTILVGNNSALGTGTMQFDFAGGGGSRTLAAVDSSAYTLNNNFNLFFNALTLGQSGGTTGTLTLGASTNTFNLGSDGTSTTRTITVNGTQIIGAAVTGGANNNLNKAGSGTLILAGDASGISGTITNSAGRLQIGNGSTTGTIGNDNVTVTSGAELAFNRSDNLSYGGVVSGAGSLLKFGAGTLTLSTANTFTGTLTIGAGGLSVSANNNLGGGTAMTISNAAKLLTTASFTSARSLTVGDGGAEINVATNTVFTSTGAVSGSTALTKTGGGTLSLSNASSSYNGTVAVTAGTMQVNGTASSMNVNITNSGSVLMGAGSIGAVTVNSGTFIAPGNSVGNLLVSELTLQGGGGYNWEINASTGTAGTDWDLITVGGGGGNVAINSSQESPFTIFLQGNPTGWNVASNYSWTIIDAGTLTGFATNAFAVNFGGFTGATPTGTFSFSNVSGNLVMAYAAAANVYNVTVATGAVDQGAGAGITGGTNQFTGDYTLNKLGAGTLVMTNPANNYTGLTTVKEGTIQIDANAPNNAAGALGTANTAVIIGDSTNNVAAGFNIGVAGVTNGRGLSVVAGTGAADRVIGTTITSGVAEQAGTVAVNTNTTFNAATGGTLLVSGAVSGAGNITISNGGTNIFSGANTYSGTTTILTNATLTIANNSALGTTGSATTVNDGGTLALSNNISTAENITIAGSGGTNADGALRNISGANTNSGTVTLSANATISADSGTRLSLSNVDITGAVNRSVTFDGAGTNIVTGSISTAGGSLTNRIIKSGSGELVISNNGTTGTGQLRLGEGTVVLAAGSLTTSQNTGTRAIDIGLSGDAVGTSTAANATLLARSGVTVSNSIYVAPSGGDGSFTRTIGTESTSGTVTYNNQMYLGGSVQLTSAGTANLVYSGNITNDGTLNVTKIGAGSLTLSATNTWRGGLIAGEGTTILSGGNAVWDTNAVTVSNNATLALGASETIGSLAGAGTVTLGANSLVTGSNSSSTTYSGVIGGTGGIFKNGTGTFTLAGANTYSGDTIVNGGTLAFSNGSVNSSIIRLGPDNSAGNTTILLSDSDGGTTVSSTLVVQADAGSTRSLVSSNSSGTNTYGGSIYLDGTATISQQAAGVFALTGSEIDVKSRTLTLSSVTNGNVAVSSTIFDSDANTGNIAKTGNGTVTLTGANAYAGTTLISGGTLQVGDGGATGQLGAGNVTNNASLVVNRTGAISIGNTISGTGSLTKTGAGTLTLGASNSFGGNVNITGGAISISAANRLGATNNTLNLDGGTLLSTASFDLGASRTLNIGVGGGTLFTDSGTQLTFNGIITNASTSSTLTKLGLGTLSVGSGSGSFTGNTTVGQGVLLLTTNTALSQSFVTVSNGAVLTNNFSNQTIDIGDLEGAGTVNAGSNSVTVGSEGNNTTFSGAVNISGSNNFTTVGSGTLTLSGKVSDTQTGTSIVGAGALQLSGADNRLSTNAALAVSNGAVLDLNGVGQRVTGLSGAGTITNSPLTSGRLIVNVASNANTFSGTLQGGMDFEKTGAGTMVLAGNNGFTGAVNVLGGTLSVGADNNLGNAANAVTLSNNTAAVNFSSSFSSSRNFTVATGTTGTLLAGSGVTTTHGGSLSKNGSVLVFGGGGSFIVNGVISGASANSDLVVSNSTVTLNSANTYSGPTYVHSGGTLNVGINNAMPTDTDLYLGTNATSGTVNLQGFNQTVASLQTQGSAGTNNVITLGGGNLTVNSSSSSTYAGLISGAGSVVKSGTGTLALTAANTYSGSTTISNGTLQVSLIADGGVASSIGTNSTVTMAGANATNAVLDYTGGNVSTDRAFVMDNGGGTINMASSTTEMTLTGSASGTGKLIVGEGTLVLSNATANSFAPGSIQVDSGATLQLAASDQIGNTTGLILNGGTFRIGTATTGFSETLGTLTLSASSTIDLGAWSTGVRQLTFANSSAISWTGTLTITNWQGVALQSSDVAEILFGTGGLTSAQLGQVYWANQNINGGTLVGGELVPIPEPRVYAAAVALLAAVGWRERKRLIGLLRRKR